MTYIELVNTTTSGTCFIVNGLLPGITYELSVVAVSQGGIIIDHSQTNDPATGSTEVTNQLNLCCIDIELFVCCMSLNVHFQTCSIRTCTYAQPFIYSLQVLLSMLPGPTSMLDGCL